MGVGQAPVGGRGDYQDDFCVSEGLRSDTLGSDVQCSCLFYSCMYGEMHLSLVLCFISMRAYKGFLDGVRLWISMIVGYEADHISVPCRASLHRRLDIALQAFPAIGGHLHPPLLYINMVR